MMSALKPHDVGQPDSRTLATLLRPHHAREALARFCGARRHKIERMHFSASRPLAIDYRIWRPDGVEQTVFAQWIGSDAVSFARAETDRLQKSRRGQLRKGDTSALLGDTRSGLVLRYPGLDGRLPGLRMLHQAQAARDFAVRFPGVTAIKVSLRAHRLGKRAVLQFDFLGGQPRRAFVRLRPVSSLSGRRAYERHVALYKRLRGAVALPEPLGFASEFGASGFSALPGVVPTFKGGELVLIAGALYRLQRVRDLPIEHHSVADELSLLESWFDRVRQVFPDRSALFLAAFDRVCHDLLSLPNMPAVPCHRDFHEGQILVDGSDVGLLDFDTLRLGDPALDPGNLLAHLRLAAIRTDQSLPADEAAFLKAMELVPADRIIAWKRAALLRLAAIYSFTSEPPDRQRQLLHEVV